MVLGDLAAATSWQHATENASCTIFKMVLKNICSEPPLYIKFGAGLEMRRRTWKTLGLSEFQLKIWESPTISLSFLQPCSNGLPTKMAAFSWLLCWKVEQYFFSPARKGRTKAGKWYLHQSFGMAKLTRSKMFTPLLARTCDLPKNLCMTWPNASGHQPSFISRHTIKVCGVTILSRVLSGRVDWKLTPERQSALVESKTGVYVGLPGLAKTPKMDGFLLEPEKTKTTKGKVGFKPLGTRLWKLLQFHQHWEATSTVPQQGLSCGSFEV